jgi:hypothetical protein
VVGRPTHAGVDKVEGVLGGGWEGGGGGGGRVIGGGGWGAWAFDGYGRPWVGAVEFHFGKVCVEGALFFGKALEEENGFVRASGRANHVTVVEEAELVRRKARRAGAAAPARGVATVTVFLNSL